MPIKQKTLESKGLFQKTVMMGILPLVPWTMITTFYCIGEMVA